MAWFAAHFRIKLRTLEEIEQTNGFLCTFLLENSTFTKFERQFQSTGDPWRMQTLGLVKKLDIAKFCSRGFNTFNRQKKKNANL